MSLLAFTSARERRLWAWTASAVAVVYATLGLASTLAGMLPHEVLTVAFVLGLLLVGVVILTQGLTVRPGKAELVVGLGIATVYSLFFLRLAIPERSHLMEYGVIAVLAYEALQERGHQGRAVPLAGLVAIAGTTLIGMGDEYLQLVVPGRVFDTDDILFNTLAAGMAVTASATVRWVRVKATSALA